MKPSEFLPSFFKHAKRVVLPRSDNEDVNLLAPDDPKPVIAPVVAPATDAPAIVAPVPDSRPLNLLAPPIVPPSDSPIPIEPINVPDISQKVARGMGHVAMSKSGRPQPLPVELDPVSEEKTLAVNKAYQNYDPAAQPAKGWHKWVPTMISGALRGFGRGGLGGAIFGAAEGGIGGATDPSRANREWQQKKLGQTAPIVAGIQKERKAQADIEEQQAETAQRRATPLIAAAELQRKQAYDDERLKIQQDVAEGRKTAAQAQLEMRSLEMRQRAEEGRLNRESRENIAGMRPDASAAAAAEGEALASSTSAAAGALQQELDQHKGQLMKNEQAITQKEGIWKKKAAEIVAADDSIKMSVALERVKAADPDVQSGTYDQAVNNTKALRDAVGEKEKRLASMAEDIRKGSAKAARTPSSKPAPSTRDFSIGAYIKRNKGATSAEARAYAAKNYPGYAVVD